MDNDPLSVRIARTARHLRESQDSRATAQSAVEVMHASVDGCDAVSLSLVKDRGKRIETVAATDEMGRVADELQIELGEGPLLDAVCEHSVVRSEVLEDETRWTTWGPHMVARTGARSLVSFQLFTNADRLGALTLYSKARHGFDDLAVAEGSAIAAQVSIAVAASLQLDSMAQGLAGRTVIGQATGILMERYDMDEATAFGVLTRMSSQGNIKLRELAAEIVEKRAETS